MAIIILFIVTIVSFWLSAICGGGASLILIPILNTMLPGAQIPFALTTGTFSSSLSRIVLFRKQIKWKIFAIFVPFSIPAVLLGGWLLKYINPHYLQLLVALFLIANIPELFKKKESSNTTNAKMNKKSLGLIGFLASFVSGVTGAVGLLFNKFYFKLGLTKEEIVATRAANEIFLHILKLGMYIYLGLATSQALYMGITIAIGAIVSSYTVKFILPYISEHLFKKLGFIAMILSGVFLFSTTIKSIQKEENITCISGKNDKNSYTEIKLNTRNISIVLSNKYWLEIEKEIGISELPTSLMQKFNQLNALYRIVKIEKTISLHGHTQYEFKCTN